jgi:hypothetical protein
LGKEFWSLSIRNPDFTWIFIVAFLLLCTKTTCKFITKLPVFVLDPPNPRDTKAAHFDCLRVGLDLSFLGLVATFALFRIAFMGAEQAQIARLATFEPEFIMFQVFLMTGTLLFTAIFHSPEKHFYRGIWIPSMIGFVSVYSSVVAFRLLITKGG